MHRVKFKTVPYSRGSVSDQRTNTVSRPLEITRDDSGDLIRIRDEDQWLCHIPNFDEQNMQMHFLKQKRSNIRIWRMPKFDCPHDSDRCEWIGPEKERYGPGDEFGELPFSTKFGMLDLHDNKKEMVMQIAQRIKSRLPPKLFVLLLTLYWSAAHTVLAILDNEAKTITICDPGRGHTKSANGGRIPKAQKNSNLGPGTNNREKINQFAEHLGFNVVYGTDGEGLSALEQYKDSCAITCAVGALFYTSGAKFVPKFSENVVRKIFCKMLYLAEQKIPIDIVFNNDIRPRKKACQDFIEQLFNL